MSDQSIAIVRAGPAERDAVASLFDRYRVFYEQSSDIAAAQAFIGARLRAGDSTIFFARRGDGGDGLGFVQLYPSFSSVSMRKIWILNDLYVAPEARRLTIRTRVLEKTWVQISVIDSGHGFAAEQYERLFEPFYTTKPQGLGLGLSISRAIIRAHGGRLWGAAERGRGASFHIALPSLAAKRTTRRMRTGSSV